LVNNNNNVGYFTRTSPTRIITVTSKNINTTSLANSHCDGI